MSIKKLICVAALVAMAAANRARKETPPVDDAWAALRSSSWSCTPNAQDNSTVAPGIIYNNLNCTGVTPYGNVGPIAAHLVTVDLRNENVFVTPVAFPTNKTDPKAELGPLSRMMQNFDPRLVAGINGGYFYRVDLEHFFDDVCIGKLLFEAEIPPTPGQPNTGAGDGATVIDGVLYSNTCNPLYGFNMPTALVLNGSQSYIMIQPQGAPPPPGALNVIVAGPNLVSEFANGTTYVNVPAKDQNLNILEQSANTAVGLKRRAGQSPDSGFDELVMVAFDGTDSCFFNPTCGITSKVLASFMKDYVAVNQAMSMDQGGSTTMIAKGMGPYGNGLVTCTNVPQCSQPQERNIFNGLAVGVSAGETRM